MSEKSTVGSPERPLRVAIIGAGPSGFYAAESLLKSKDTNATVDMIDRLPTPFGLVRGGVAPDHQGIKKVVRIYDRIASDKRFRLFGNIRLGVDITVDDLRSTHDAIIYAFGAESDRKMNVPGEDLPGSHSATEFVGWYNGHPDYTNFSFDLSVESAVVVGVGNVAIDVARVLARHPDELKPTDIAAHAIPPLEASGIKTIYLLGRRGGPQAAFSPKEIRELAKVENADLIVSPEQAALDAVSEAWLPTADRDAKKNTEFLMKQATTPAEGKPRQVVLKFLVSPVEFIADDSGKLTRMRLRKNELYADKRGNPRPRAIDEYEEIDVGIAFKAVGYRGVRVPGVPFHESWGIVPNVDGRVTASEESTEPLPGEYVVGWAKRGPSGLIGTNKADSIATVVGLLEDYKAGGTPPNRSDKGPDALESFLNANGRTYVSYQGWKAIDAAELARGEAAGKLREKVVTIDEMVKIAEG